jgi:hypothetical protein
LTVLLLLNQASAVVTHQASLVSLSLHVAIHLGLLLVNVVLLLLEELLTLVVELIVGWTFNPVAVLTIWDEGALLHLAS